MCSDKFRVGGKVCREGRQKGLSLVSASPPSPVLSAFCLLEGRDQIFTTVKQEKGLRAS